MSDKQDDCGQTRMVVTCENQRAGAIRLGRGGEDMNAITTKDGEVAWQVPCEHGRNMSSTQMNARECVEERRQLLVLVVMGRGEAVNETRERP
mmetsp:Transcript_12804/g.44949  ORF Transcript_12804/g.44949 Transcript_12804/m.44949 type:complete len:93 (-) Transcript_12804:1923-2201(-)